LRTLRQSTVRVRKIGGKAPASPYFIGFAATSGRVRNTESYEDFMRFFPRSAATCGRFETPGTALRTSHVQWRAKNAGRGGRDGNQWQCRGLDLVESLSG